MATDFLSCQAVDRRNNQMPIFANERVRLPLSLESPMAIWDADRYAGGESLMKLSRIAAPTPECWVGNHCRIGVVPEANTSVIKPRPRT